MYEVTRAATQLDSLREKQGAAVKASEGKFHLLPPSVELLSIHYGLESGFWSKVGHSEVKTIRDQISKFKAAVWEL
jgi:hypothetical protein